MNLQIKLNFLKISCQKCASLSATLNPSTLHFLKQFKKSLKMVQRKERVGKLEVKWDNDKCRKCSWRARGEKATEREWKKWLIEFNVSCATLFDQKLLKKFTPLPCIVKRFFHSPNCPEHDSYCDNFSTFFFGAGGILFENFCEVPLILLMARKAVKLTALYQMDF